MKQIILTTVAIALSIGAACGQQLIPFQAQQTREKTPSSIADLSSDSLEAYNKYLDKYERTDTVQLFGSIEKGKNTLPRITETEKHLLDGQIIGIGGASDIAESKTKGGNFSLGAYLLFTNQKSKHFGRHAVYAFWNTRPSNSEDTAVLARTFLFPEIGRRDLTVGYEWPIKLGKTDNLLNFIPSIELSCSKNKITSETGTVNKFYSYNLMLGTTFKISSEFPIGDDQKQFGLSIRPYYQLITVDPKDFETRNAMLDETSLPPTFHTTGLYFTLQVAELSLFGDYRRILNNTEHIVNNDLKEGVFVLGISVSPSIFHFTRSRD